jgi:hypothetical protein
VPSTGISARPLPKPAVMLPFEQIAERKSWR